MRELEERFAEELTIVGVHSGKFIAERETSRIADASRRLGVRHPVVNDRQFRIWRSYAVRAWPTIVMIDPGGYVLGMHAGEFTTAMIAPALEQLIAKSGEALNRGAAPHVEEPRDGRSLRYPGKIASAGRRLAIADSGNDRVVLAELNADDGVPRATVTRVFGDGRGYRDGTEPLFDHPQGVLFDGDDLLVADAFNHTIRSIDLTTGVVSSLAGTGQLLRTRADAAAGALSSPWDLARADEHIAVAMAGNHRLYLLDREARRVQLFAGSGAEELHDGPLATAALAQPMGICADDTTIYFADSETSAIREAALTAGGDVTTIIGTGLFDFGDVDGEGAAVRLQHAQGVLRAPNDRLLIVDSYNDALKWLDRDTQRVTTWVRGLHEPGGAAWGDGVVYVADTNAHRIAVVRLDDASVRELALDWGRTPR